MASKTQVEAGSKAAKQKSIVEIYTDWANHYLEKTRGRHKIRNLQTELTDGLLLAEVIEAVTHQKVPDITKKPKTRAAMVTNIQACLGFLLAKGVAVEEVGPEEIHEGNLKAILGLFFQLSRFKQQQKQLSSTPASPAKLSSIPVPGSLQSPRKTPCSGLKHPGESGQQKGGMIRPPSGRPGKQEEAGRQSMLQKMKMIPRPGLGKRTSSSSGFSSARSTLSSESSMSLSSDTNFPSPSALRRIQETEAVVKKPEGGGQPGAKLNMRTKFTGREKSSSPKRSPKLGRPGSELKDYGMIDSEAGKPRHYPPHAYSRSNSGVSLKHTNISSSPRGPVKPPSASSIPSPRNSCIKPPCPPVRCSSSLEKREGGKVPAPVQLVQDRGDVGDLEKNTSCKDPPPTAKGSTTSEEVGSEPPPLSSHRTCTLPRARRRGASSPSSQPVAVVSPMPSIHRSKSSSDSRPEVEEDPLRGIAPMAPLGGVARAPAPVCEDLYQRTTSMSTINSQALFAGQALLVSL